MRRVRTGAWIFVVWATAATTLFGNTPYVVCHCPDGSLKLFCFGSSAGKCCCSKGGASACCSKKTTPGEQPKKACCCQKQPSKAEIESGCVNGCTSESKPLKGLIIGRTCCQKTVVQPEVQTLIRPDLKAYETQATELLLLPATLGNPLSSITSIRSDWQVHDLPPPTDLVTTLQRLTI